MTGTTASAANDDQPPGIDPHGYDLPDPMNAAVRVMDFLEHYGDGLVDVGHEGQDAQFPPLYARDLQALANAAAGIPGTLAAHDLTVRQVTTERDHLRIDLNTTEEHLTDARRERDEARNKFLDHYNATSGHLDRIRELETALRERTGERDAQTRLAAGLAEERNEAGRRAYRYQAKNQRALDELLQGGQAAGDVRRAAIAALQPAAEPNACGACGAPERGHFRRYDHDGALGWHTHVEPTDAQRKARMHARRAERPTPGGHPYRQHPHPHAGESTARQEVGDPGHCEDCCSVGHIVAHPDLGCGDVGCNSDHQEVPGA